MALKTSWGSFAALTGNGNQVVSHSLGEEPDLMMFWTVTNSGHYTRALGFTYNPGDTTQGRSGSIGVSSQHNATTKTDKTQIGEIAAIFKPVYNDNVNNYGPYARCTAWSSTNFTMKWYNNASYGGETIRYCAFKGFANADIDAILTPVGSATQTIEYSNWSFQPDMLIAMYSGASSAFTPTGAMFGLGFSDGTNDACNYSYTYETPGVAVTKARCIQRDRFVDVINWVDSTQRHYCTVDSLDSDGYTLAWQNCHATYASRVLVLGLKVDSDLNLSPVVKKVNSPSDSSDYEDSALGKPADFIWAASNIKAASASEQNTIQNSIGFSDVKSNCALMYGYAQNGVYPTNTSSSNESHHLVGKSGIVTLDLQHQEQTPDGFILNNNASSPAAREFIYLTFGTSEWEEIDMSASPAGAGTGTKQNKPLNITVMDQQGFTGAPGTHTQAVSDPVYGQPGDTPSAIIMTFTNQTSDSFPTRPHAGCGMGFIAGTTANDQVALTCGMQGGKTSPINSTVFIDGASIIETDPKSGSYGYNSAQVTGFAHNQYSHYWASNPIHSGTSKQSLVFCGLEDQKVVTGLAPTSDGIVSYNIGFRPDIVFSLFWGINRDWDASDEAQGHAAFGHGFSDGARSWCAFGYNRHVGGTSEAWRIQIARFIANYRTGKLAGPWCVVHDFTSTGFRLNWSNTGGNYRFGILALKGVNGYVNAMTEPSGSHVINSQFENTDPGFSPQIVGSVSATDSGSGTIQDDLELSFGWTHGNPTRAPKRDFFIYPDDYLGTTARTQETWSDDNVGTSNVDTVKDSNGSQNYRNGGSGVHPEGFVTHSLTGANPGFKYRISDVTQPRPTYTVPYWAMGSGEVFADRSGSAGAIAGTSGDGTITEVIDNLVASSAVATTTGPITQGEDRVWPVSVKVVGTTTKPVIDELVYAPSASAGTDATVTTPPDINTQPGSVSAVVATTDPVSVWDINVGNDPVIDHEVDAPKTEFITPPAASVIGATTKPEILEEVYSNTSAGTGTSGPSSGSSEIVSDTASVIGAATKPQIVEEVYSNVSAGTSTTTPVVDEEVSDTASVVGATTKPEIVEEITGRNATTRGSTTGPIVSGEVIDLNAEAWTEATGPSDIIITTPDPVNRRISVVGATTDPTVDEIVTPQPAAVAVTATTGPITIGHDRIWPAPIEVIGRTTKPEITEDVYSNTNAGTGTSDPSLEEGLTQDSASAVAATSGPIVEITQGVPAAVEVIGATTKPEVVDIVEGREADAVVATSGPAAIEFSPTNVVPAEVIGATTRPTIDEIVTPTTSRRRRYRDNGSDHNRRRPSVATLRQGHRPNEWSGCGRRNLPRLSQCDCRDLWSRHHHVGSRG